MEEQNKAKTVDMNKGGKQEGKKLTYEQLNDACNQLWQQNKQLVVRNRELEQFVVNKRLDYLFKALESKALFSGDFIVNCTEEIEEALYPHDTEEENKEK